ncbi:hypothetical protein RIF29_30768 [Crotalaria pallida]|uniref:Uncharacterized protein n=1 Tax=Crotalaria pallida TaxID=3830 RepID=A0AAN9I1F8_CROPI
MLGWEAEIDESSVFSIERSKEWPSEPPKEEMWPETPRGGGVADAVPEDGEVDIDSSSGAQEGKDSVRKKAIIQQTLALSKDREYVGRVKKDKSAKQKEEMSLSGKETYEVNNDKLTVTDVRKKKEGCVKEGIEDKKTRECGPRNSGPNIKMKTDEAENSNGLDNNAIGPTKRKKKQRGIIISTPKVGLSLHQKGPIEAGNSKKKCVIQIDKCTQLSEPETLSTTEKGNNKHKGRGRKVTFKNSILEKGMSSGMRKSPDRVEEASPGKKEYSMQAKRLGRLKLATKKALSTKLPRRVARQKKRKKSPTKKNQGQTKSNTKSKEQGSAIKE